ncbi:hypothetical protein SUGI_0197130 [Cryptomeria japonica]|nr:hypothetical protein SUGI_0197130 [Cryptomeria japonica]
MGLIAVLISLLFITLCSGALVQHDFTVGTLNVTRLCKEQEIVTVNGQFPGPTIYVHEGDYLLVRVKNEASYNVTIHWHGVRQYQSGWADGPAYITQCPISPGTSYNYFFRVIKQEGTLWWHAHITWLRATLYGSLIVYPRKGHHYPFQPPAEEFTILLGEWWNANVDDVLAEGILSGLPNGSDAYTINGQPGDLYPCSASDTYNIVVEMGKTYLLRVINAGMNEGLFFKIANHKMTVVAVDASYTKPYESDLVVIYPGQTTDVLLTANEEKGSYYMAAKAYLSGPSVPINNSTTTAILEYKDKSTNTSPLMPSFFDTSIVMKVSRDLRDKSSNTSPLMPSLPEFNDTSIVTKFSTSLRSLSASVPQTVDQEMLITAGLGLQNCPPGTCEPNNGTRFVGCFNNISFVLPKIAVLQAHFFGIPGVFTTDFPDSPPLKFNYTDPDQQQDIAFPEVGTKVKVIPFNSIVQIVLQGTSVVTIESHPVHLHGFDFYVVGQGFGNYDPLTDPQHFNLVDPQQRNTIGVPSGGWAAIRFRADNPGAWFMHCHFDIHSLFGFDMVLLVENGPGIKHKVPPPPLDLPKC